jgi:hypothetical protein
MHCREFHRNHSALLDNTISAIDLARAQQHMMECRNCADHDTSVRRALLVFRNLPTIEPSRRFAERLNTRLLTVRLAGAGRAESFSPAISVVAVAAGLFLTIGVATAVRESQRELTLPAAVALSPETTTSQHVAPAIAASMSAGFPAWPAAVMLERASQQLDDAVFHFTSQSPR